MPKGSRKFLHGSSEMLLAPSHSDIVAGMSMKIYQYVTNGSRHNGEKSLIVASLFHF